MCFIQPPLYKEIRHTSFALTNKIEKQNMSFVECIKYCIVDAVIVAFPEAKSKVEAISVL